LTVNSHGSLARPLAETTTDGALDSIVTSTPCWVAVPRLTLLTRWPSRHIWPMSGPSTTARRQA